MARPYRPHLVVCERLRTRKECHANAALAPDPEINGNPSLRFREQTNPSDKCGHGKNFLEEPNFSPLQPALGSLSLT